MVRDNGGVSPGKYGRGLELVSLEGGSAREGAQPYARSQLVNIFWPLNRMTRRTSQTDDADVAIDGDLGTEGRRDML